MPLFSSSSMPTLIGLVIFFAWLFLIPILKESLLQQKSMTSYEILQNLYIPVSIVILFFSLSLFPWFKENTFVVAIFGLCISSAFLVAVWKIIKIIEEETIERKFSKHESTRNKNIFELLIQLVKPISVIIAIILLLWLIGVDVKTYLVTFGSLGVAVGFAMQHVLANILAGMSLAIDTPFSKDDLIRIGSDPQIYQVIKRGLRITTVRNVATHEIVFLPNKSLTEEQLIDVTRPTDDLRSVIDIGVPYESDLREVRAILSDIANGHPHIIGSFQAKEKAIQDKILRLYIRQVFPECKSHLVELARLKTEDELNKLIQKFIDKLNNWADFVDQIEEGGFKEEAEQACLKAIQEELKSMTSEVSKKTTAWQISFRNSTASFRPSGAILPEGVKPDEAKPDEPKPDKVNLTKLKT